MKNTIKKINISNIRLLPNNPRYTISSDIDIKNINFGKNYDQASIIVELLEHEDDWKDLYELIQQLKKGYNKALDQIFVIKGKDNFDYVIEGNRRIMVMNFINKFDHFRNILEKYKDIKMYKNVINELEEIKEENHFDNIEVSYLELEDNTDESEVWTIIYTRHAGENKGKRSWSRLKYFYDLKFTFRKFLDNFSGDIEITYEKLSQRFNKSKASIKSDISSSLWVTEVIDTYNDVVDDKDKISKTKDFSGTSSLELCLSLDIKLDFKTKKLNELFDIKKDIENWKVKVSSIDKPKLYTFLVDNIKEGNLTTRGWKEENIDILYNFLGITFSGEKTLATEIKEAKKINENERNEIQKTLVDYDNVSNEILSTQMQLSELKEYELKDEIKIALKNMWLFNGINKNNLNKPLKNFPFLAVAALIRSTLELISYYVISNSDSFHKLMIEILEQIKSSNYNEEDKLCKAFKNAFGDKIFNQNSKIKSKEEIKKEIYRKCWTKGKYNLFKKICISKFVDNKKFVESIFSSDNEISNSVQLKKVISESSYIVGMITGKNLKLPNEVIHTYYKLNNIDTANYIFTALTRQLDLLNSIINIWIFNK
ncbi:hypothetical protein [Mycoplasma capricolum]|uniref:hypothetical protein n=1 Tax=Mycoplasma capricolum TaxID=2095 RepID=UPI003DA6A5E4